MRRRPSALLVQNPSLVLAAFTVLLRPLFRYRLVVDAHNEAVEPFLNRSAFIAAVTRWVLKRADVTIVTNEPLARVVRAAGGRPFVLPDRIPTPPQQAGRTLPGFNVALIATFAADEPCREILQAVAELEMQMFVTGNFRKLDASVREAVAPNVTFTGFLSEADYWELLRSVDAVVDLTTMDNCLVCGSYEAVALRKPLLLSRSEASVALFADCALFTDNSTADIRERLLELPAQVRRLEEGAVTTDARMTASWQRSAAELRSLMQSA
jgi:hypothetical protein